MTPLQIKMVLHYYAVAEPYAKHDPIHANSSAVSDQRAELIARELLESCLACPSGYRVTERGKAYVDALCLLPLPIKKWVMPDAA